MRFCPLVIWALVGLPLSATVLAAQTRPELIRGRVTTDSGRAISGAEVIATMAPNRDIFRAMTDSTGQYEIRISNGTGDYLVHVSFPGREAFRRRVTRTGAATTFVVDARLAVQVQSLLAMHTVAPRMPPPRADDAPSVVGGLSSQGAGIAGALSPDQMGDLAALAATVPGVTMLPGGGYSVFGLPQAQNRVALNGMTIDAGALPRDLDTQTRVVSSSFDPAIGGFGGALVDVSIRPGQVFTFAYGHLTLDAPQLQSANAAARTLGEKYGRLDASYGRSGELVPDTWVYSAGVEGSRRLSDATSLLTANSAALERLGVSGDSASRFLGLVNDVGIPTRLAGIPNDVTTTSVNAAFRLDRAHAATLDGLLKDTRPRFGLVGIANYSRSDQAGASTLAPPSHAASASSGAFSLQANSSRYFGSDAAYLDETRAAVSYNVNDATPYLAGVPGGTVRLTSALPDGMFGISNLAFGGGGIYAEARSWRWEGVNELSFSPAKAPTHRIKIYTQAELDGVSQANDYGTDGTFTYSSLADFAGNTPASFSRSLVQPRQTGGEASGAVSVGDYWNESADLQFVFGPRLEWSSFTSAPAYNPAVDQLLGVRTDVAPSAIHMSPRFGFTWLYPGKRDPDRTAGGAMQIASLGRVYLPPKGVLRGGVGEFRSLLAPGMLSSATASTGLAGQTALQLQCIGAAVPTPNWAAYVANPSSIPTTCADGTGAAPFVDDAPSVEAFDPSYSVRRRWTANLSWASSRRVFYYSVDASYTLNLDQPGIVDANFLDQPRFALANEDNRPVFVEPASIVPSTGLVSPLDARRTADFSEVLVHRSDLRSTVRQATVTLEPLLPQRINNWILNGSYTFSDSRALTRGFDGAAFGDPTLREWSTGAVPRHEARVQAGYRLRHLHLGLTSYWSFQSGFPYTPLVGGDVNGDGTSGDRAFVFAPGTAAGANFDRDFSALLQTTSSQARDCLERQIGQAAGRNSCRQPWSMTMNARMDWQRQFGDRQRYATVSLNFSNPLALLDRALHGPDHVQGWGLFASSDPTLYYVRGFDPVRQRFIYQVNPAFGNTRPDVAALYNPFRVSLDVSISLPGNIQKERVAYYLRPTRSRPGERPPADTILARIRTANGYSSDPYTWVLSNADSLLLSVSQADSLVAARTRYQRGIDSTWQALAEDLAKVPKDFDPAEVTQRIAEANRAPASQADELRIIGSVLTPTQRRLLPDEIAQEIEALMKSRGGGSE